MRVSEEVIIGDCRLILGDCLSVMRSMPENSVDAIVTDPPYGLSFMGNHWDKGLPSAELWAECLRVLKPGGHLLAFAGTRTQHRMATAIEDGGFEIRDMIAWVYGSGFPKSLDVSKAIDKAAGARGHDAVGFNAAGIGKSNGGSKFRSDHPDYVKPVAITEAARHWQGWGTALKPAIEPITVARKPLIGTVAANVLAHGTGAINVDASRVESGDSTRRDNTAEMGFCGGNLSDKYQTGSDSGRWPANLIHDGSDDVFDVFPQSSGQQGALGPQNGDKLSINAYGDYGPRRAFYPRGDTGSAARFFYCAKASKSERGEGNIHPTVKPLALMRYLCRLVTPSGGVVLDPFLGSGSTAIAAIKEWFACVGIERELKYFDIACERIENAYRQAPLVPHVQQVKQVQEALL